MTSSRLRGLGAFAVLGTVAGCSGSSTEGPQVMVADIAGVEIVTTSEPLWGTEPGWTVGTEPVVSIGEVEGETPYLFGQVAGAVRVDDRIVVGDGLTRELRYFDLSGLHIRTVAGAGDGPGELRSLYQVWRCEGNRVYAIDIADLSVQARDSEGEFIREVRTVEPEGARPRRPYTLACAGEGPGFAGAGWGDPNPARMELRTVPRQMAPVWILDEQAQLRAHLGEHLSSERFVTGDVQTGRVSGSGPHPFGRATTLGLGPQEVIVGTGEALSVDVYTLGGQLSRRFRGPAEDLSVTESVLAAYRAATLDGAGEQTRTRLEQQGFPMPGGLPAFTELRLDGAGHVWVRRFALPGSVGNRWGVFAPDGAFLGHLELPPGLRLTDVGPDWILGVHTDELGVGRVRMYSLTRQ